MELQRCGLTKVILKNKFGKFILSDSKITTKLQNSMVLAYILTKKFTVTKQLKHTFIFIQTFDFKQGITLVKQGNKFFSTKFATEIVYPHGKNKWREIGLLSYMRCRTFD